MHANHQSRPIGTSGLLRLTLEIPPFYLTTNQLEEYPQADQAPCNPLPHFAFKIPSPKAIGRFRSFEQELPILLPWPHTRGLAINSVLPFIITRSQ